MGNRPVPTALKLLRGNPGKRPISAAEPQPDLGANMPTWLSKEAQRHWQTTAKALDRCCVLTELDQVALAAFCETFARWKAATEEIAEHGPVTVNADGVTRVSPHVRIAEKAFDQMKGLLVEFGMTPASRTRVSTSLAGPDRDADDPFAEFL